MMLAHTGEAKLVWIRTTRLSLFFRRLLEHYASEDTSALIDGRSFPSSQFPQLMSEWASNAAIRQTHDFTLLRSGVSLFGFHDHPGELWGLSSELAFIQELALERIIRYRIGTSTPSLWQRLKTFFLRPTRSTEVRNI